jgi:hypothetical protein
MGFAALAMAFATAASAQVNSWINPVSGNWDQVTNWSQGVLPNSSQSVMITNVGFKAVAINPSTAINFSNSMTVSNLTLRGATNAYNLLLLNFFGGTGIPLIVLNGLTVDNNAQILNLNSGLIVQSGTITVTNAEINQDGGFVRTTNSQMYLQNATYNLTNGDFAGGTVSIGIPGAAASFNQYGGNAVIANLQFSFTGSHSTYALYGGNLNLPGGLNLFGENNSMSTYLQNGGTNRTPIVFMEASTFGIGPSLTLNGGLLADGNVQLMGDRFGSVAIEQNGGTHIVTNTLSLIGGAQNTSNIKPAEYHLNGGTLSAGTIDVNGNQGDANFIQSSGTASAGTFTVHSVGFMASFNSSATLSGGMLSCSNFTLDDGHGSLNQSGGALVVSNLLTIGGFRDLAVKFYGHYTFTGGTLTASNINITGDWIIGDGSTNRISNPGFISLSHTLQIGNAVEQLGRFILASNATINLAGSASRLSFANSSSATWNGAATLVVTNWNGNPSGGGAEQLKFGTSASGLTAAQLNQIRFQISSNLFSAKILGTGEVVPDQAIGTSLTFSKQGSNLMLTWPSGWTLQSATDVRGPYLDVEGATSPYTVDTTVGSQGFFRLLQQ